MRDMKILLKLHSKKLSELKQRTKLFSFRNTKIILFTPTHELHDGFVHLSRHFVVRAVSRVHTDPSGFREQRLNAIGGGGPYPGVLLAPEEQQRDFEGGQQIVDVGGRTVAVLCDDAVEHLRGVRVSGGKLNALRQRR